MLAVTGMIKKFCIAMGYFTKNMLAENAGSRFMLVITAVCCISHCGNDHAPIFFFPLTGKT